MSDHERSRPTILAVEDEPLNQRLLHAVLDAEGFRLVDAATLAEARARVREQTPDLILLDLRLPDGDGLDLCRELKADASTAGIPIIVASASAMPPAVAAAAEAGSDGFLAKPIRPRDLLAEVRRRLDVH